MRCVLQAWEGVGEGCQVRGVKGCGCQVQVRGGGGAGLLCALG